MQIEPIEIGRDVVGDEQPERGERQHEPDLEQQRAGPVERPGRTAGADLDGGRRLGRGRGQAHRAASAPQRNGGA